MIASGLPRLSSRHHCVSGSTIATVPSRIGIMIPKARYSPISVLPLNRYSDRAKAAMAPNRSTQNRLPTVTIIEFRKYWKKSP